MQQPAKYVSVSRHKKASGVDEVPLSQQEFDRLAKDNFRDAHRAYAAEKNKVVQQCRPFALDDEDASTLMVPVSDEIKLSAEEFKKQAQENYLSSMSAYQGQKDKTVTSTGSKECFSPPEGPKISEFVAEVASNNMPFDKFMAEAASNRAQASNVFRQQMGRVRQSSMASPEKIPEDPQLLGRVGDGATRAHHALWRQKRDKRFMETEYAQSEVSKEQGGPFVACRALQLRACLFGNCEREREKGEREREREKAQNAANSSHRLLLGWKFTFVSPGGVREAVERELSQGQQGVPGAEAEDRGGQLRPASRTGGGRRRARPGGGTAENEHGGVHGPGRS